MRYFPVKMPGILDQFDIQRQLLFDETITLSTVRFYLKQESFLIGTGPVIIGPWVQWQSMRR